MRKVKIAYKKAIAYIAARKILKYSLVAVILLLPTGAILTNKYLSIKENNIEKIEELEQSSSHKNDKDKVANSTINTDAVLDKSLSKHTLSGGYSTLDDDYVPHSNSTNSNNNTSNTIPQQVDKSSISGIDLEILEGHEFNPKKDLKLKATDRDGSNITDNIIIESNTVNTKVPGIYNVKVSIRLNDGQSRQKEFTVTVKETRLDVSLGKFKVSKENINKGENIGFDISFKVSKKHVYPTAVMINGQEYTLYKGNESILYTLSNKKNYKTFIKANEKCGIYEYNLDHVKMSNGSWISLGDNNLKVQVLKTEASIDKFNYEEKGADKKVDIKFNLIDLDNTSSNLRLEFCKNNKIIKDIKLDKLENYLISLPTNSNGIYNIKIISDINLNTNTSKKNTIINKEIFNTNINISNVDQTSITGNNIELNIGDNFDFKKDLELKATDFDGEDITDKIEIEGNNIDTSIEGTQKLRVYVINKYNKKYTKEFEINIIKEADDQTSITGNNIELNIGDNFNFKKDLGLKATDFDGKDITDKIEIEGNNIDTSIEGTQKLRVYVINKFNKKYTKEFEINIIKETKKEFRLITKIFDNLKERIYERSYTKSNSTTSIIGDDSESLTHNVEVTGIVSKADGSAPNGKISVELPTVMSFTVDQKSNFISPVYMVKNNSSLPVSVSVSQFIDSTKDRGIIIKPIDNNEDISKLSRTNVNLALVGNTGKYADLGKIINEPIEVLRVNPLDSNSIRLYGQAGKADEEYINNNGMSENFTLIFKINKANLNI